MRWRLYYDDGSTFDNDDGAWNDAPHLGVITLVTEDPDVGRELDHGARGEFYAWWPEASKPWGFDRIGILDYLQEIGFETSTHLADLSLDEWRDAGVKLGRSVDNKVFRAVIAAATSDPDFPPKSADSLRERRD